MTTELQARAAMLDLLSRIAYRASLETSHDTLFNGGDAATVRMEDHEAMLIALECAVSRLRVLGYRKTAAQLCSMIEATDGDWLLVRQLWKDLHGKGQPALGMSRLSRLLIVDSIRRVR